MNKYKDHGKSVVFFCAEIDQIKNQDVFRVKGGA